MRMTCRYTMMLYQILTSYYYLTSLDSTGMYPIPIPSCDALSFHNLSRRMTTPLQPISQTQQYNKSKDQFRVLSSNRRQDHQRTHGYRQHERVSSSSSSSSSFKLTTMASSTSPSNENENNGNSSSTSTTTTAEQKNIQMTKNLNLSITAILLSTSLNLLGFTMTSPLTPTLGQHFSLELGASFGSLTSAYPLGMLAGLFLWPRLSDTPRWGRKRVMAFTLMGSGLGLGMQSVAVLKGWSLEGFLMMRAFTGCFAGSSPVAKAFLADLVGKTAAIPVAATSGDVVEEDGGASGRQTTLLTKYLAWRDASSTLAYIIGPALGGTVFELYRRMSFIGSAAGAGVEQMTNRGTSAALAFVIGISALASLVAATLIGILVKTEEDNTQPYNNNIDPTNDDHEDKIAQQQQSNFEIIACPLGTNLHTGVATVCVVSFLYHVADSTFFAFFPALLSQRLGLSARGIGLAFTAFATVSFGVSASSLSARCIRGLGVVNTCAMGLGTVGCGLALLGKVAGGAGVGVAGGVLGGLGGGVLLGAAGLYFCGVPLYGPTIPTMLLQCVPPYQRGAVMGLDGAVNTIARVISPIIMGDIYRRKGASAAFGLASIAVFLSAAIALFRRFLVLRDNRRLSNN